MKIKLLAIGDKMPAWVDTGVQEYARRLPPELGFELQALPMSKRAKTKSVQTYKTEEAQTLSAAASKATKIIALDVAGKHLSTEKLVDKLQTWRQYGDDVALLVGGPDGLDQTLLQRADERWSLSDLTLPHPIVRVIFVEQLYRAWSITQGHPYHR